MAFDYPIKGIKKTIQGEIIMTTLLIAAGGNGLEIPCRIFEDMVSGKEVCDRIFGFEGKLNDNGELIYTIDMDPNVIDDEGERISDELFTGHYYGCGGPYCFILKEVPFDTKFIGWDLD